MNKPWQQINFFYSPPPQRRPRVAISRCLQGDPVRYDGNSKPLALLAHLSEQLELIPVCPEVEAGLSTPRAPVQLVISDRTDNTAPRALGRDDPALDITTLLYEQCHRSAEQLRQLGISGYLFKSRSPSCGLGSTPLFNAKGEQLSLTSGLQAAAISEAMPWLALFEETELLAEQDCERFITHCMIIDDLRRAIAQGEWQRVLTHYDFDSSSEIGKIGTEWSQLVALQPQIAAIVAK